MKRRYGLDAAALEYGSCNTGTNHKTSGKHRGMPFRKPHNCTDFWNVIPFVRVRREEPCEQLAKMVGFEGGVAAHSGGKCRLEISLKGREVTSLFLRHPTGVCGGETTQQGRNEAESFLLVTPPPTGQPGRAIDEQGVWTT